MRRQLGGVRLKRGQFARQERQERQRDQDTHEAVDEIAQRQAPARRIAANAALNQRIDGAAEIGAKHQSQRGFRRYEMRIRKRHHQQHHGGT